MVNRDNMDAVLACMREVNEAKDILEKVQEIGNEHCRLATGRFDKGAFFPSKFFPLVLCEKLRPIIIEHYEHELFEAERELRIAAERLAR